jgi:hypothetical protein
MRIQIRFVHDFYVIITVFFITEFYFNEWDGQSFNLTRILHIRSDGSFLFPSYAFLSAYSIHKLFLFDLILISSFRNLSNIWDLNSRISSFHNLGSAFPTNLSVLLDTCFIPQDFVGSDRNLTHTLEFRHLTYSFLVTFCICFLPQFFFCWKQTILTFLFIYGDFFLSFQFLNRNNRCSSSLQSFIYCFYGNSLQN